MKRTLLIFFFLLPLIVSKLNAQSTFQKHFNYYSSIQDILPNDDLIIASSKIIQPSNLRGISISKFNKCGNTLWAKTISVDTNNLDLVDFKIDQYQNAILTGHYILSNGYRKVFLMSISSQGSLNFFKVFNTKTGDIVYSIDINPQNEVLLFFKTNISQAGPNSENTLAKINANGQLIWIKQYGFTGNWGRMCSTSDGGALISDINNIVKFDSLGHVSWNKTFESNFHTKNHFEIPGGYVFLRYQTSALNRTYVTMTDYSGNVKWNSQLIQNFIPANGIFRKNGNLLFAGNYQLQSSSGNRTFIEIDTSNGTVLNTVIHKENWQFPLPYYLRDLSELSDQSIYFSGYETLSFSGSTIIGRVNDTLSRVNCNDTSITLNFPIETSVTQSSSPWSAQSVSIPLIEPSLYMDTLLIDGVYSCKYGIPLSLDLGKDSTLCPGDSLILSATANFEGYEWSTNQTTASIKIGKVGTYWLKAWIDCDTISDTIQISYHSLPELELGKDTTVCQGEELTFSTNNGETAYWSTGDTAKNITVNQAGKYWANVPTVCGFVSDTIELFHYPKLQDPKFEDTIICLNTHLQLNVDPNATSVLWSTGETSHQIQTDSAGTYFVTIANKCDTISDTLKIKFHPKPNFIPTVSEDTALILDSVHFHFLSSQSFQFIQWDFGDGERSTQANTIHQYKQSGRMHPKVTFIDSLGCQYDSSLSIYIQHLEFHIPNVFTPNGDGVNDYFKVFGKKIKIKELKIFNRWGDLMYKSDNSAWDGRTLGGKSASEGTYYYQIRFIQEGASEKEYKGVIYLINK